MYFIGVRSINSLHSEQLVEFRKKFNETSLLCDKKKKARTYIACSQLIIYFKLNFQQSNFFFQHFVPLYSEFEALYARNCYNRVRDIFERPISSAAGARIKILDRYSNNFGWTFR